VRGGVVAGTSHEIESAIIISSTFVNDTPVVNDGDRGGGGGGVVIRYNNTPRRYYRFTAAPTVHIQGDFFYPVIIRAPRFHF